MIKKSFTYSCPTRDVIFNSIYKDLFQINITEIFVNANLGRLVSKCKTGLVIPKTLMNQFSNLSLVQLPRLNNEQTNPFIVVKYIFKIIVNISEISVILLIFKLFLV